MLYNTVDCPHCGNPTSVKSTSEPQKCQYCRRLLAVTVTKRSRKGRKLFWEVKPVEFESKFEKLFPKPDPRAVRRIPVNDRDKFFGKN